MEGPVEGNEMAFQVNLPAVCQPKISKGQVQGRHKGTVYKSNLKKEGMNVLHYKSE